MGRNGKAVYKGFFPIVVFEERLKYIPHNIQKKSQGS
jgi:hypothetical protein